MVLRTSTLWSLNTAERVHQEAAALPTQKEKRLATGADVARAGRWKGLLCCILEKEQRQRQGGLAFWAAPLDAEVDAVDVDREEGEHHAGGMIQREVGQQARLRCPRHGSILQRRTNSTITLLRHKNKRRTEGNEGEQMRGQCVEQLACTREVGEGEVRKESR
jgi:hypothetical protein